MKWQESKPTPSIVEPIKILALSVGIDFKLINELITKNLPIFQSATVDKFLQSYNPKTTNPVIYLPGKLSNISLTNSAF